jgi:hypothetical protein
MEYIDGPSLATRHVPPDQIATIGVQLASALAALHAAGIVHGDVKPANILVADTGVKLTDFGIARTGDDTTALTQEGVIFATPEYAAPETLSSGARTPAADVYALGAVLHELLTGHRWDRTTTATQAMPPAVWVGVLSAALDQDPDRRPTAADLGAELVRIELGAKPAISPDPTTAMAAAATTVAPAMANRTSIPPPVVAQRSSKDHRDSRRRALAIFAGTIISLGAVAGVFALSSDGGGVATMAPIPEPASGDDVVAADTTATPDTVPPTEPPATEPPVTEPPVTEPPPTEPPVTEPPVAEPPDTVSPARQRAEYLAELIAAEVARGLEREEAIAMIDDLNDALEAAEAGRTKDIERALRDAQRRIDRQFADDTRDEAVEQLAAFGAELGVEADRIVDERTTDRDDDSDD